MATRAERGNKALAAMKAMGFPIKKTKPILKNLLRACENNWEHIEAENYSLLIETVLVSDEAGEDANDNQLGEKVDDKREESDGEERILCRKRHRQQLEEQNPLSLNQNEAMASMKNPKPQNTSRKSSPGRNNPPTVGFRERTEPSPSKRPDNSSLRQGHHESDATCSKFQGREVALVASQSQDVNGRPKGHPRVQYPLCFKEPKIEPGLDSSSEPAVTMDESEPLNTESPSFEVPIAVIHPQVLPSRNEGNIESPFGKDPTAITSALEVTGSPGNHNVSKENEKDGLYFVGNKRDTINQVVDVVESSTNIEITSSTVGEAKVSLLYNVVDCPDFRMPSLESVLKRVEDKCLRSYKILDPNFSIMNIMNDVCNSLLELGTESVETRHEVPIRIVPSIDALKTSWSSKPLGGEYLSSPGNSSNSRLPQSVTVAMNRRAHNEQPNHLKKAKKTVGCSGNENVPGVSEPSSSLVLVHQHEPALGAVRPIHDVDDITKGEERVRVSIVNEFTSEKLPPHFSYIPHNLVFQNAYLNFSLARIGDEDYCSDCFGDCLSASVPCACARETGGEFAYSRDGLLKKEFLDNCMSMSQNPQKDRMFYCKECPLERSKDDGQPDACKGHLVRKFIKECWSKCGCNKQCGNRVVQRGITCNLQIFFTSEGKGWGLRTLDELPRGAFVCEYVGEVLTNTELYDRTIRKTGNARHTYPVLLDADWGSEGVLKDEEALCLDATFYGNVARFVNHRCYDASLIDVPVEVETPDRHYYHLAFFTSRKIEAFEELTWDYGIDFEDHDHPIKAFRCLCGSRLCRDIQRPRRRRSGKTPAM